MADQRFNDDTEECTPRKKSKLDNETSRENDDSIHETEINLSDFQLKRVLQNNDVKKQISVEGTFKGRESSAIVLLEKKNFPDEELLLKKEFFHEDAILQKHFRNDIYGKYEYFPSTEHNGLNVTIIHPATVKHIERFERRNLRIIDETYEIYEKITLPYIESHSFSLQWVDNILKHKMEEENIIYEDKNDDTGFILITDLKWDRKPNTLKLLALPFRRLKSIRELNASHLPLLRNIRDAGVAAINEKFKVPASQLRIYLHYQPSYYHLHVHFCYLMFETPGIYVEKAHLLSTVIKNIELMPDYYAKAILSYVVSENDPLFIKLKEHGVLTNVDSVSTEV